MTTTAKTEKTSCESRMIHGTRFIGIELVPKKLVEIVGQLISVHEGRLYTLLFSESMETNAEGKRDFSSFYQRGRTIEIDLEFHLDNAIKRIFDNDCLMNITNFIWYNLLVSVFHEFHHTLTHVDKGVDFLNMSKEEQGAACDEAQEWALNKIHNMANVIDIEAPELKDWGTFFEPKLNEFIEDVKTLPDNDQDHAWVIPHRTMLEEGLVYFDPQGSKSKTLREFCKMKVGDNDPVWEIDVATAFKQGTEETLDLPGTEDDTVLVTGLTDDPGITEVAFEKDNTENMGGPTGPGEPNFQEGTVGHKSVYEPHDTDWDAPMEVHTAGGYNETKEIIVPRENPPLTLAEIEECCYRVYMRLAGHMLRKCQYNPRGGTFINPHGVMDGVFIGDIPNAARLFVNMDCVNPAGQVIYSIPIFEQDDRTPNRPVGYVQGRTFADATLPGYWLKLQIGEKRIKRTVIPQNARKAGGGQWAQQMANGHFIVLIYREVTQQEKDAAANAGQREPNGIKIKIECAPSCEPVYTADPLDKEKRKTIKYPPLRKV